MNFSTIRRAGFVLALSLAVAWFAGVTWSPAQAEFWMAKCQPGYSLLFQDKPPRAACRKMVGNHALYKTGKCFQPGAKLRKHTHKGYNYACETKLVVTRPQWQPFRCTDRGYKPVKKASGAGRTCIKWNPRYSYKKPTF